MINGNRLDIWGILMELYIFDHVSLCPEHDSDERERELSQHWGITTPMHVRDVLYSATATPSRYTQPRG